LATDCSPKIVSPSLRRMVLEAAGSAEPPVQLEATWLVPQADTLIVHQLAVLVSQALLFLALGQGSVTISARVR
jgi:hypothetical protein